MDAKADVLLTEIHRQARGNPILRVAEAVRTGGYWWEHVDGKAVRAVNAMSCDEALFDHNTIICGTNRRRRAVNHRLRKHLGLKQVTPYTEEILLCLQNDYDVDVFNGETFFVDSATALSAYPAVALDLRNMFSDASARVVVPNTYFEDGEVPKTEPPFDHQEFDFGYTLTAQSRRAAMAGGCHYQRKLCLRRDDAALVVYRDHEGQRAVDYHQAECRLMNRSTQALIESLGGDLNSGMCRCPAHDDQKPSLHVGDGNRLGTVFVCFAHCSQDDVINALSTHGLWPLPGLPERPAGTPKVRSPAERRAYALEILRDVEADAGHWRAPQLLSYYFTARGIDHVPPTAMAALPNPFYCDAAAADRRNRRDGFPRRHRRWGSPWLPRDVVPWVRRRQEDRSERGPSSPVLRSDQRRLHPAI